MTLLASSSLSAPLTVHARPYVRGKFIFLEDEKLYIRGVTYGTFRPDEAGDEYHREAVRRDFGQMAASGLNAVRTYTVPPRWLLDMAQHYGLRVMVGLPWEQHVAFLDSHERVDSIEERVRAGVRACAGHPAILCYVVGNEIPASILRWYGHRRVENYLERLYRAAKAEDPGGLVTYVNYPSTEYLDLPFIDFVCFNVYLEQPEQFDAYLARLHTIANDRPLIMSEIGLDSLRNGEAIQAQVLDWQIRIAFASGCAGAFVFAWTDEWYRGGHALDDWAFGLTTRDRRPKPALAAVRTAFAGAPFPDDLPWPCISVVVCSYNGQRTIRDCLEGLLKLKYPNFEVIVVNDGSTDATAAIASEYPVRLISTDRRGLSNARNLGIETAAGAIVAYIDDDAYPDAHWLTYLAATFMSTDHAGVGGPNITPPGDGSIADCVANTPGGPVHILLSDQEAEHIPGCNMAFRKADLEVIGGFDPQYRVAGDDVDICWRLQEQGWTLGFSPAALIWHHRRNSTHAFWRQQYGYGAAEALLEKKWPEKYTAIGYLTWAGQLYGPGGARPSGWRQEQIHHGTWGSGLFQSLYQPASGTLSSLPLIPEWYLVIIALAVLAALGTLWSKLFLAVPLLILAIGASFVQAALGASRATFTSKPRTRAARLALYSLTAFLHLLQPLARLYGRARYGLTPWRRRGGRRLVPPWPRRSTIWSEHWRSSDEWLRSVEASLRAAGAAVIRGGAYNRWELEVRSGVFGSARVRMAIEEHGEGQQLVRFCTWPRCSVKGLVLVLTAATLSANAALDQAWAAGVILAGTTTLFAMRTLMEYAAAMVAIRQVLQTIEFTERTRPARQPTMVAEPHLADLPEHCNGSNGSALLHAEVLADELGSVEGASRYSSSIIALPPGTDRSNGDRA
jgi:GT2 family glycosyltransferase